MFARTDFQLWRFLIRHKFFFPSCRRRYWDVLPIINYSFFSISSSLKLVLVRPSECSIFFFFSQLPNETLCWGKAQRPISSVNTQLRHLFHGSRVSFSLLLLSLYFFFGCVPIFSRLSWSRFSLPVHLGLSSRPINKNTKPGKREKSSTSRGRALKISRQNNKKFLHP